MNENKSPLQVLVVDDSAMFRNILCKVLDSMPQVKVVGTAKNGEEALDKVAELKPDLVTLDINMPRLDGPSTLKELRSRKETVPVVVLSGTSMEAAKTTIHALELGALDFLTKPSNERILDNLSALETGLRPIVQQLIRSKSRLPTSSSPRIQAATLTRRMTSIEAIGIGVSTGGPKALGQILPALSEKVSKPIFIVQHMPENFTKALAKSLDEHCRATVIEAENNFPVKDNYIYIAPGKKQMKVARVKPLQYAVKVTDDPPECFCQPSADYLFRSLAECYGSHALGVIMTGIGYDGTKGLGVMKAAGASVIAQDQASCTVYGMPRAAIEAQVVDAVVPLSEIPNTISKLIEGRTGANT